MEIEKLKKFEIQLYCVYVKYKPDYKYQILAIYLDEEEANRDVNSTIRKIKSNNRNQWGDPKLFIECGIKKMRAVGKTMQFKDLSNKGNYVDYIILPK